ncbi:MAG TPA: 23S rRNA (pseudouridine(1915)-N(3))-methyltransferase RlmH [Bryobacteraceae bacterium]|nr:23S rRNA (pseudouridine(1915)-N(3))-methyltransferase RlmH [Bryobacteraceae bacterium]
MKIHLYFIGRPKDPRTNAIAADFVTRAGHYAATEMREIRPERFDLWARHPTARKIFCDPAGKPLDSAAFSALIAAAERDARDLVFLIGGHDGLPEGWRERADLLLSLSPLTMPHELARAVLAEQIYRAFATLRGHPYPR